MDIHEKIDVLRRFPDQAAALIDGLSEAQLTAHPLEGEWSVAQNIHHCADSHMNSYIRLKLILTEDNPTLKPYDQETWAETPDSTNPDVATSLALLRGLHARWTLLFASLSDDQWTRTGYHPEYGSITPAGLLDTYVDHCQAHLDQIERTIAAGR
jgi:hypothetical protein